MSSSISGLRKGTRIRLATLGSYDGNVYSVAADAEVQALGASPCVTGGCRTNAGRSP
jgi:hypothetical protein